MPRSRDCGCSGPSCPALPARGWTVIFLRLPGSCSSYTGSSDLIVVHTPGRALLYVLGTHGESWVCGVDSLFAFENVGPDVPAHVWLAAPYPLRRRQGLLLSRAHGQVLVLSRLRSGPPARPAPRSLTSLPAHPPACLGLLSRRWFSHLELAFMLSSSSRTCVPLRPHLLEHVQRVSNHRFDVSAGLSHPPCQGSALTGSVWVPRHDSPAHACGSARTLDGSVFRCPAGCVLHSLCFVVVVRTGAALKLCEDRAGAALAQAVSRVPRCPPPSGPLRVSSGSFPTSHLPAAQPPVDLWGPLLCPPLSRQPLRSSGS